MSEDYTRITLRIRTDLWEEINKKVSKANMKLRGRKKLSITSEVNKMIEQGLMEATK